MLYIHSRVPQRLFVLAETLLVQNQVAKMLEDGSITMTVLSDLAFEEKMLELGETIEEARVTQAFAYGESIYLRESLDIDRFMSSIVHEGVHAIDWIDEIPHDVIYWEQRARYYERQFQLVTGMRVDFRDLNELTNFILQKY